MHSFTSHLQTDAPPPRRAYPFHGLPLCAYAHIFTEAGLPRPTLAHTPCTRCLASLGLVNDTRSSQTYTLTVLSLIEPRARASQEDTKARPTQQRGVEQSRQAHWPNFDEVLVELHQEPVQLPQDDYHSDMVRGVNHLLSRRTWCEDKFETPNERRQGGNSKSCCSLELTNQHNTTSITVRRLNQLRRWRQRKTLAFRLSH